MFDITKVNWKKVGIFASGVLFGTAGISKQKILHINHYFSHRTIPLSFSDISDVSAIFLFFFSLTEKNGSVCPHKCGQISILYKKITLPNKKQSNFHI